MCLAYSYVRFSHPSQAQGDSLRRQTTQLTKFCADHKLTLSDLNYQDLGLSGFTGANKDRGALKAFCDAVAEGKVKKGSVLIVEQLDRLTRLEVDEALSLFGGILRSGVKIGHLKKNRILDKSCLQGFEAVEFVIELILANEESRKKSIRVKEALHQHKLNAQNGIIWTAKGPSWLELNEDRSGWIVIEQEAEKVRTIFNLCVCGLGVEAICKKLVADGIAPLPNFTLKTTKVKKWNRTYIRNLLRSRIVIGEYQPTEGKERNPDGDAVAGYYIPIITEEVFYKAQAALESRTRHRGPTSKFINVLGGLMVDAETQSTMYCASKKVSKQKDYIKVVYPSASVNGAGKYWSCNLSYLEQAILGAMDETAFTEKNSHDDQLNTLVAKQKDIKARMKTLEGELESTPDFNAGLRMLKKLEAALTDTLEQIDIIKQKEANKPKDTLLQAKSILAQMKIKGDTDETRLALRGILRNLIEKITLHLEGDQVVVVIIYSNGERRGVKVDRKTGEWLHLGKWKFISTCE